MTTPSPLQSFVGGIGLALPVFALLRLNGCVFGISGFLHRAIHGSLESIASVAGLVFGGVLVGLIDGTGASSVVSNARHIAVAGLLVGIGTKVKSANYSV